MFTLRNHFLNSYFLEYYLLGAHYLRLIDSLPDRAKIMKNEIFRPGSFLEHLGGPKLSQLISYNRPRSIYTSSCPEVFQKNAVPQENTFDKVLWK